MNVLAVMRHPAFSPNHVGNDAAILRAVADALRATGLAVAVTDEEGLMAMPDELIPAVVVHMARRAETLARLSHLKAAGRMVVNDPDGVMQCAREAMSDALSRAGLPRPRHVAIPTARPYFADDAERASLLPGWIKRGDHHAVHREDVSYARTPAEADGLLAEYAARGIARVVVEEHLHGDLVKFYGVADDFFYWFYPMEAGHGKFGLEACNDTVRHIPFDADDLRHGCVRAARAVGVSVYGGDCIIAPDGTWRIIDLNDWPSFAPCRDAAAASIAQAICVKMKTVRAV